jgi:hypothetical protein
MFSIRPIPSCGLRPFSLEPAQVASPSSAQPTHVLLHLPPPAPKLPPLLLAPPRRVPLLAALPYTSVVEVSRCLPAFIFPIKEEPHHLLLLNISS